MREVEVVVVALDDRQPDLERVVEERRRGLADAAADGRQHQRPDDLLPLEEAAAGRARADDPIEREDLAGPDQRPVDEVRHQVHVVNAVRRGRPHVRRERGELPADAEGVRLARREVGIDGVHRDLDRPALAEELARGDGRVDVEALP
jgi:hypothetical protein